MGLYNCVEAEIEVFLFRNLAPPPKIKTSEWAARYRVLSAESCARPGRWKNDQTPHLVEIMDAADDSAVEEIVVMSSSQIAKSEGLNNIISRRIDCYPGPMLMMQPTGQTAEDYSKDRLAPMFRDCERLARLISQARSRDSSNTLLHKQFPGGHLTLVGSNSPSQLASRPIRDVYVDEVDRMKPTTEGDPVSLIKKRTITFRNRLIVYTSTPTIKGLSRIEDLYNRSDKRRRFIACPKCGKAQVLEWSGVKWDSIEGPDGHSVHKPETARYECSGCQYKIYDRERRDLLKKAVWRATAEFRGVAGFHISELYSMWRDLREIVRDFLDSKDSLSRFQVFVNTVLGETFRVVGQAPAWKGLYNRRESYDLEKLPARAAFVTAGADVQADRIHVEFVAWGRNFETWSLGYEVLHGDTAQDQVWQDLDLLVARTWRRENGSRCGIARWCIDGGYNTKRVHAWAQKYSRSRVAVVVGRDSLQDVLGTPAEQKQSRKLRGHMKAIPIGVSKIKEEFYGFLRQPEPTADEAAPYGYCHFPEYGKDYFREITSEEIVSRKKHGYTVYAWELKPGRRNEALDCRAYNRAAAAMVGIDRFTEREWSIIEGRQYDQISARGTQRTERAAKPPGDDDDFWKGR